MIDCCGSKVPAKLAQSKIGEPTEASAKEFLPVLLYNSATGPDEVPTRALLECSDILARPFCKLARRILTEARRPEL